MVLEIFLAVAAIAAFAKKMSARAQKRGDVDSDKDESDNTFKTYDWEANRCDFSKHRHVNETEKEESKSAYKPSSYISGYSFPEPESIFKPLSYTSKYSFLESKSEEISPVYSRNLKPPMLLEKFSMGQFLEQREKEQKNEEYRPFYEKLYTETKEEKNYPISTSTPSFITLPFSNPMKEEKIIERKAFNHYVETTFEKNYLDSGPRDVSKELTDSLRYRLDLHRPATQTPFFREMIARSPYLRD